MYLTSNAKVKVITFARRYLAKPWPALRTPHVRVHISNMHGERGNFMTLFNTDDEDERVKLRRRRVQHLNPAFVQQVTFILRKRYI